MKTLLLLGGSAQQVVAIETAKCLGCRTVLCDYLPDNPGQYAADRFYLVSTTDLQAVLDVARRERVDGVLAYASDPAAPTAAYVAQTLGLPGNPYRSVEILCNKDLFRQFLAENGFHTPLARGYDSVDAAVADIGRFNLPVIVKPVDSSGSKGATVLRNKSDIRNIACFAMAYSRKHRIIIEDYIENAYPYLIGGDIFVINGHIALWGLLNCHRDVSINPLVPVGKSYPPQVPLSALTSIKETLSRLVTQLHIKNGSMNVELIIDKHDHVYPIDIGPRCGGNMIPDFLGDIFHTDIVKMSVQAALGQSNEISFKSPEHFYATHNLHSGKRGIFRQILFSDYLTPYLTKVKIYKNAGDPVEVFDNASKCLGVIFMKFLSLNEMLDTLENISSLIDIQLD